MSPSVKKNENLSTTCSLSLRIFILALVVQLANSIPNNYRSGLGSETNFDSTGLSYDGKKPPGLHTYQAPIELTVNFNVINEPDTRNRGDAFKETNDLDYNETPFKGTINARLGESDNDAVGPMNERQMLEEMFRPKIPAKCEGKTVCDKTESEYPMELAQQLVRKLKQDNVIMMPSSVDISPRTGDTEDTQNLCREETRSSYDEAVFANGTWHYVLQTPEFAQKIENIYCINPDKPCTAVKGITDGPDANEVSVCKQQYTERHLLTLNPVNGGTGVISNPIRIPSGCCCHYRNSLLS